MTGEGRFAKPRLGAWPSPAPAAPPRRACARSSRCRTARRRRGTPRPAPSPARPRPRSARMRDGKARSGWGGSGSCRRSPAAAPPRLRARKPSPSSRLLNTPSNTATPAARAASTISWSEAEIGSRVASSGRRRSARRSLVPAMSPAVSGAISAAASTPAAVSIIASTGLPTASATPCTRCAEIARGTTTRSAFDRATASRSSECHSRADAVDPDRDRHRPGVRHRLDRRLRAPNPCPPASPHLRGRG